MAVGPVRLEQRGGGLDGLQQLAVGLGDDDGRPPGRGSGAGSGGAEAEAG